MGQIIARYTETRAPQGKKTGITDRDNREAIVKAPDKTNNWDHDAVYVTATIGVESEQGVESK